MGWRGQDLRGRSLLDDLAAADDGDVVRDLGDDAEVVRDEHVADAELALQPRQQAQHLVLHRDVERRHRLVEVDELRLDRERPGDRDALTLAARELVGAPGRGIRRQPDEVEQLGDARAPGRASADAERRRAARRRCGRP